MSPSFSYRLIGPASAGEGKDLLDGKNPEDRLRRVQALLSDWLRMENLVVLTAAGCSVAAGGRLMSGPHKNNLECLVLDAVDQCELGTGAKRMLAWKRANDYGKGNFERWLSYLFNAQHLVGAENSPIDAVLWKDQVRLQSDEYGVLCRLIERAVFAECGIEMAVDHASGRGRLPSESGHIPFLAKLVARDATLGRTHLFTLNYDTLFEQALEDLGIHYFDGFSGRATARFDPSVYGLDLYYPGDVAEGRVRRFDKFLHYYKLHGSIHWSRAEDGSLRARHQDLSFTRRYRAASAPEKAKLLQSRRFEAVPEVGILPTSQKLTQTLEAPYAHLFRLFHARVNQPQTFLLVLGYGFGDDHVNQLVEAALTNPSLVMLVVEPDPASAIVDRVRGYQDLGHRAFVLTELVQAGGACSYRVATFSDFARNVLPDVKWLNDYRRLRAFEEQLKRADEPEDS